jgi:hypothetical protein
VRWTEEEKEAFTDALIQYQKDWRAISERVHSKTPAQCKQFFINYRKRLGLDDLVPNDVPVTPVQPSRAELREAKEKEREREREKEREKEKEKDGATLSASQSQQEDDKVRSLEQNALVFSLSEDSL